MAAGSTAISVKLDTLSERRIKKAAVLLNQSQGTFLRQAGDQVARRIVLDWAVGRYRRGGWSFGELAQETGLAIEEIMQAMSTPGLGEMFDNLASGRDAGEKEEDAVEPDLYSFVERAVAALRPES